MGVGQTVTSYDSAAFRSATGSIVRTIGPPPTAPAGVATVNTANGATYITPGRRSKSGDPTVPYGPMTPVPTGPGRQPSQRGRQSGGSVTVTWSHNSNTRWRKLPSGPGTATTCGRRNLIGPARPTPDGAGTSGTVTSDSPDSSGTGSLSPTTARWAKAPIRTK
jgi:hypothetical protein